MEYEDLRHTRMVANRTFVEVISKASHPVDSNGEVITKVLSEGAWKIELCWTGESNACFLTFDGNQEISLAVSPSGAPLFNNNWAQFIAMVLDGDVNTVRDDIIGVRIDANASDTHRLIVVRHKVVWKRDDNLYPAQLPNRRASNVSISENDESI